MENASLEKEIAKLRKENEEFKRRENAFRMRLAVVEQHNHELEVTHFKGSVCTNALTFS